MLFDVDLIHLKLTSEKKKNDIIIEEIFTKVISNQIQKSDFRRCHEYLIANSPGAGKGGNPYPSQVSLLAQ